MIEEQKQMVLQILEQNGSLSASKLAGLLSISLRTVHNYIGAVNQSFPGAIVSTPGGYYISPENARAILNTKPEGVPQTPQERSSFILSRLVQGGGNLRLQSLCDELYISVSTFNTLLGRMRRITREFDLNLTVNGNAIFLTGSERNKRRLVSSLLYSESEASFTSMEALQAAFPTVSIDDVREDILATLNEYEYFINEYSLMNLLLHVIIAVNRIKSGCTAVDSSMIRREFKESEISVTQDLAEKLENRFGVKFSEAERYELALLLISRASAINYHVITPENIGEYIGNDNLELVKLLIRTMKEFYDIDLDEPEFFTRFALHIYNLMVRTGNMYPCRNPLAEEIRSNCPLIYDVSVQLSGIIREQTGVLINEDEIAYIALHLGGAMEIQRELSGRVPAVLYCPSYYNMDIHLSERIAKKIGSKIILNNVFTLEGDLGQVPPKTLVISTIRPTYVLDLPLVVISPFLTNMDCLSITRKVEELELENRRESFRQDLYTLIRPDFFECGNRYSNREELVHYLCGRLKENGYVDENYENLVLERDRISSTAFTQFAIPHTLKMTAMRTGMYVYVSKSPIKWGEQNVNLVMLLCMNPNDRKIFYQIFEPLTMILMDTENLKAVMNCRSYSEFCDFLISHVS